MSVNRDVFGPDDSGLSSPPDMQLDEFHVFAGREVSGLYLSDRQWSLRINIIATLILVYIFAGRCRQQSPQVFTAFALILSLYLALLWSPREWWNASRYAVVSALIIALTFIVRVWYGVADATLLWPLVGFLASVEGKHGRVAVMLASITIGAVLLLLYTRGSSFPFGDLLFLVGMFVGIRSRRTWRDAYRLSRLHLQELEAAHAELKDAHAELQESTVQSMRYAALEERTRIAREIHDGLGHQLTSLIVQLQALQIRVAKDTAGAADAVRPLLGIAREALSEVRTAVKEWSDDEAGLGPVAMKGLVSQVMSRSSLRIRFVQDGDLSEWSEEIGAVLYRVLQESLTNILRHAQAATAEVRIREDGNRVILTVADDGRHTGDSPLTPGFGLKGVVARCRAAGGVCTFSAVTPHGFRIQATLPIGPADSGSAADGVVAPSPAG